MWCYTCVARLRRSRPPPPPPSSFGVGRWMVPTTITLSRPLRPLGNRLGSSASAPRRARAQASSPPGAPLPSFSPREVHQALLEAEHGVRVSSAVTAAMRGSWRPATCMRSCGRGRRRRGNSSRCRPHEAPLPLRAPIHLAAARQCIPRPPPPPTLPPPPLPPLPPPRRLGGHSVRLPTPLLRPRRPPPRLQRS